VAGITYKVMQNPGEPTKFRMEARFANLADIFAAGGKEVLDSDYAGLVGDADGENTVALDVDLNGTLPCPKGRAYALVSVRACFNVVCNVQTSLRTACQCSDAT